MELFKAHRQWAVRPADERFPTLQALHDATRAYVDTAGEVTAPWSSIRAEADSGDVLLVGKENVPAKLTNWAFGQLSARVGAPADYLRHLPATLAVQNINHGLAHRQDNGGDRSSPNAQMLFHANGGLLCRAVTSDRYARIWNYEIAERLLGLQELGWEPATPDIRPGDLSTATALYASDHDLFAFLRNPNLTIEEQGSDGAVYRGVIVENSEVGASALKLTRFLYREMCGNHIIWGASKVIDFAVRHVGHVSDRVHRWETELRRYAESSASDEEAQIASARTATIAGTKDEVLDRLFGLRSLGLSRKTLAAGYDAVVPDQDGDPKTTWGMVQGLTRHSQTLPYADKRNELDRAAGRLLTIKF